MGEIMDERKLMRLGGEEVWIDAELVPLIRALNDVGLITRSHCSGHKNRHAWVAITLDNITSIEVRVNHCFNEILLKWDRPKED